MIHENIEKSYKNLIEEIKKMKGIQKKLAIGVLIHDIGGRCITAISNIFGSCWSYSKSCLDVHLNGIVEKKEMRGRKKITFLHPLLKEQIKFIVADFESTDPDFKSEKLYLRLTVKEVKNQLISRGYYTEENCIAESTLSKLLNELGYNLRKVQKTKPLKKIPETDVIFENVHEKKEHAVLNEKIALISLDTKDKILLGPFSRQGENRFDLFAVDHELTNNCLIPFGILDIKKSLPYFFNFGKKTTLCNIIDCIEEFYKEQYLNSGITRLSILLDNGPDNRGVRTIFLSKLIDFSNKYNIEVELIYYPPYHSKYNPVERLWV